MPFNILATKLHQPALPPRRVERPHLIQRLNEGLELGRALTLVSAPAGFGKTTCVCEWLSANDIPAAWLALEAADDDPGRFFPYFLASLRTVDERLGREIDGVLRAGQVPPQEAIIAALINDLLTVQTRFVLVLDDFHLIQERSIVQVLERLVTTPGLPLHLVLITREDPSLPLARLRARGQLTEIRAADLRFTRPEADRFLKEMMGLALSETDIATLDNRTEGWVVGLQLAGLSMRGRADLSDFITTLSGSHRYILSYLVEEVLSHQPEDVQDFLLQTSILHRLTGDLCDAVTGRAGSGALLERLFNANLFLIPLDDEQRWYRYHHLFADLLRSQNSRVHKERIHQLHQRASCWYAEAGMPVEAIDHALAGADFAAAVKLIEQHAMSIIMQGYVKTVEDWMQAIPAEWQSRSPKTNLAFAWMHLLRGTYARIGPYLAQVEAALKERDVDSESGVRDAGEGKAAEIALRAELLALQAGWLNVQGKVSESVALANQALEIAPPDNHDVRSQAYIGLAGAYRLAGDYPKAVAAYQQAIQHSRLSHTAVSEILAIANLTLLAVQHGQLRFAVESATQSVERITRSGATPPILASVIGSLALVHFEWNEFETARGYLSRAVQLSGMGGHNAAAIYSRVMLARLRKAEGSLEAAARVIQEAAEMLQAGAPPWVGPEMVAQQVTILIAQNNLLLAEGVLKSLGLPVEEGQALPDLTPGQTFTHQSGLLWVALLRVRLAQAQARHNPRGLLDAVDAAGRWIEHAISGQYVVVAIKLLLLRARMQIALGNQQASLDDIARALELGEGEGFLLSFVEEGPEIAAGLAQLHSRDGVSHAYIMKLLSTFPEGAQPAQPAEPAALTQPEPSAALVEPLSDREREVLRLLAEGMKYEEIAERLVVTLNTVRFYVKAIYSKLNVNNRTRAIEEGRRFHLL